MEDRFACEHCGLVFTNEAECDEHVAICTKTVIKILDTSERDEEVCLEYNIYIEDHQTQTQTAIPPIEEAVFDCTTIKIVKVETINNINDQKQMVLTTLQPVQETKHVITETQQLEMNETSQDGIEIGLQVEPQNFNIYETSTTKGANCALNAQEILSAEIYNPRTHRPTRRKNGRTHMDKFLPSNTEDTTVTQTDCPIINIVEPNASSTKLYRKLPSPIKNETNNTEKSVYDFYDEEYEKDRLQKLIEEKALRDVKARTCRYCKKIFNDPMDVLRHKREVHKTNKIQLSLKELTPYLEEKNRTHCPLCAREICPKGYKSLYIKHMMTHCNTKDLSCQVCGTKFKRKDYLEVHEKRHVVKPETT